MSFFLFGLSGCSNNGRRCHTSANVYDTAKKEIKTVPKTPKREPKLSDDEVRTIRRLHESGWKPQQIFDEHVSGKMTFAGMMNILRYTTRASASLGH